jgi:Mg2+ and Co2+ transporter CorA
MSTRALLSRADGSDEEIDLATWRPRAIRHEELLWVDAQDPDTTQREMIARALQLDPATLDDLDHQSGLPYASVLAEGILVTVQGLTRDSAPPVVLHVLVGREWALTWHAATVPFIDEHYRRIQDQRKTGALTPVLFLAAVLDWHVDTFFAGAEDLEREVDRLDTAALRGGERDVLDRLVAMRQRISEVRRLVSVHREVFAEIGRPGFLTDLEPSEDEALAYVAHRVERATEAVANAREMLIGTFEVHMTRTAQRTNDIMRVLTLVSVMLLPAGVLAGVMGMNFKPGFFDNPTMFWVVAAAMGLLMLVTLLVARWRRWL